jgi:hypothetical protein
MRSHLAQDIHARNAHQRSIGTLGFRLTNADAITQQFARTLQRPTVTNVVTKGAWRNISIALKIPEKGEHTAQACVTAG